jgi:hypothetical protein
MFLLVRRSGLTWIFENPVHVFAVKLGEFPFAGLHNDCDILGVIAVEIADRKRCGPSSVDQYYVFVRSFEGIS